MKPASRDSNRPLSDRRISDRGLMLPLVGCLLLMPPLAAIFQIDVRVFGIPFTGFYLFAVWAALIVGAMMLARRVQKSAEWDNSEDNPAVDDRE